MVPYLFIFTGLAVFAFSYFQLHKSKDDKEGRRVYGMAAYSSIVVALIGVGWILAPHIRDFNLAHAFLTFLIINFIAHFLLKPGFEKA